jgi:hypothetical protein
MKPGEHKTVQARILEYAEAIGWNFVSREEAERRRGFDPDVPPADRARVKRLKVARKAPRYKCEDNLCVCKGKDFREDGNDPSVGGCG